MDTIFLVTINILVGGYEKTNRVLVDAENEEKAGRLALFLECHACWQDVEIVDGSAFDMGGEFVYSVSEICKVPVCDARILEKYLCLHSFGNFVLPE